MLKWRTRAEQMQAAEIAAEHMKIFRALNLGCAARLPGKNREAKTAMFVQGAATLLQRGHDGNLVLGGEAGEVVLFQNRRVGPAPRPIELRDPRSLLLAIPTLDTVF